MPHLSGLDLADCVKKIRPDIAIILCTGYSELITPQTASDFGIDKILIKPVGIWQMRKWSAMPLAETPLERRPFPTARSRTPAVSSWFPAAGPPPRAGFRGDPDKAMVYSIG